MRHLIPAVAIILLAAPAAAAAQEGEAAAPEEPKLEINLSGFYAFNGYTQNNFFLGRDVVAVVSDGDDYGIQLLRLQPEISWGRNVGKNLRIVFRIDMAQGIWGVDNSQRDNFRPGFSDNFNNKDTNYTVHVDWAYVEATVPKLGDTTFRVGRMKNALGNLLVLDQDGDGLQFGKNGERWGYLVGFTKMFEGVDGLTDEHSPTLDGRDADLFFLDLNFRAGACNLRPFLAYYQDQGDSDGTTYLPNEIQYLRARFQPNVSDLTAVGLAWDWKAGPWTFKGEVDYLTGSDDVANLDSGPKQLLDVNNGELEGYNLYLDLKRDLGSAGTLGLVFGLGSGDDDPMSGDGNVNKIRTNGFFYVTEVWEDSVMPDEEGITPQGLGSPASRGYREFENTTLVQLNYQVRPKPDWKLALSASVMRATEPLHPWSDANGNGVIEPGEFGTTSSDDLGREIDFRIDWTLMKNLTWTLRGGYFFTGDAAGYLINGSTAYLEDAWELRTTVRFGFKDFRIVSAN